MHELGTRLAQLGGADVGVLRQAQKETGRHIALGLTLIATSALAVLSMTFAMIEGLKLSIAGAVLMGLGWGAVILIIDRALILNLKPKGGAWRLFWMVLPRVAVAALLGAVIATPLTLQVFDSEIEAQMRADNQAMADDQAGEIADGNQQEQLDQLSADIQRYERILAGEFEVSSPAVEAAQAEYDAAAEDVEQKQADFDEANLAWRCERFGEHCAGGSGEFGDGPRAQVAREKLDRASAELAEAQGVLDTKRSALNAAQEAARRDSEQQLTEAQAEASRVLPGLRQERDELRATLAEWRAGTNETAAEATGLLARLVALEHLGDENGSARLAHLLVALLLFMIELLPVTIKTLSIIGPPTLYDRIDEFNNKQVVKQVVDEAARARTRTGRKRSEIDDDMDQRELVVAKKVNQKVAEVVEEIAMEQVDDWGRLVRERADAFPGEPDSSRPDSSHPQSTSDDHAPPGARGQPGGDPGGRQPVGRASNGQGGLPHQRAGAFARIAAWLNLPPTENPRP
jgi:hypothetical protein